MFCKLATYVEVLDEMMGSGKSSAIFKWIDSHPERRYIYVSPLLSEVDYDGRIHKELHKVFFESPSLANSNSDNKSDHLLSLLNAGSNIACTHSLYLKMSEEHIKLIEENKYIVLLDEEVEIISGMNDYSISDIKWLLEHNHISISDKDGMISWNNTNDFIEKTHTYKHLKDMCDGQALYATKRNESMLVTQLPIRLITAADRVIVLTYMFKGNILDAFLKLKEIDCIPFTDISVEYKQSKDELRSLITLLETPKTFKSLSSKLSSTWYKNSCGSLEAKIIAKTIRNLCLNHKVVANQVMYTFPRNKFFKENTRSVNISPLGFKQFKNSSGELEYCWLPCSMKATNDFANRDFLIHVYKRHPLQSVNAYLQDYGSPIDIEVFALSELVQWVFRSAIRNKKPIKISILSDKMNELFVEWLNNN